MNIDKRVLFSRLVLSCVLLLCGVTSALSDTSPRVEVKNNIEALEVSQQAGVIVLKLTTAQELSIPPASFSVANPARVAFDFPGTTNGLGRNTQTINEGDLRSLNIIQAGDRTRLVLNLRQLQQFDTRVEGKNLYITLAPSEAGAMENKAPRFAEAKTLSEVHAIRDINFRRGQSGEARVIIDMSDSSVGIDIRQQGKSLLVDFAKTSVPESLRRKMDVTDFGTPVTSVTTQPQGENVRMTLTPKGLWEHNAYQSDNQLVIEVKQVVEDANKLVQGNGRGYQGEKLSLNFQNIDVRAVLQVIADFTNFNIITSDTVGGSLTLRLKDVPWDQALDIILQAKGLDMRKNGNVVWIAPRDELAAREKNQLESRQQLTDLETTRTESFQLNYQKSDAVQKLLSDKSQPILSKRGSIITDPRTNKIFVNDVPSRLEDVRKLIAEIDVATKQVMIEARIVEADDNFAKNLGVRLGAGGYGGAYAKNSDLKEGEFGSIPTDFSPQRGVGGGLADTGYLTGQISTKPDFFKDALNTNLAAGGISGKQAGQVSFALFSRVFDRVLNLELSALEADGKGKIISSPRVVTADQIEALIEQGVEIPYQQATSSGATSVSFRKANLSLRVKPQITPDGKVNLTVDVSKDSPNASLNSAAGIAIDTKHVKTEVLVENGGTVVIGGIYTQQERNNVTRIPFFGDLPYVGFLFKNSEKINNKTELLIFITPRVLNDKLSLQ